MKISAAQIDCTVGDIEANVRKIGDFCSRAKEAGVELVVFPEMADTGYSMPAIHTHAKPWTDGAVPELRKMAKALSLAIVCGVSERDSDCIYNSQVFIDAKGEIAGSYRKTHLFAMPPADEQMCFSAGGEFKVFPFGDLRLGLSICYDLRFPEVYRALAVEQGANVFVISSAWPFPRVEHFRTLAIARAIENQSYVVAANRVGTDDGVTCCGSSAIIDPYGVMLASASADREELVMAEVSPEIINSVRKRMTVFEHRRDDLYGRR